MDSISLMPMQWVKGPHLDYVMKSFKELYTQFRELILYGIIGGFCAGLDFVVYNLLGLVMPYLWANVISVHCGIFTSFFLNRQYNFKVKDKTSQRFKIFYLVGLTGLGVSELLIYILSVRMGMEYRLSKIITIFVAALLQFILNKYITFKKTRNG